MSYEIDSKAKYYKEHQWVRVEDDGTCLIGISDFAQKTLKDIIMVELPDVDETITQGEVFASVESVKAVSDVFSPISGKVVASNEAVEDEPEKINEDPYGSWIVRVQPSNLEADLSKLMSPSDYEAFCE
ncbi:MAG: glycine cleavage system protein GcvH [Candidatus Hodarchaeales archaeon]|jgi:glycine cleavage system H protein